MTDSKHEMEMKLLSRKVYALFFALFATFSFPYLAQADTSVSGFFRENLVSSSVFERNKEFSLDIQKAKARKVKNTQWRKSRKDRSSSRKQTDFSVTNIGYRSLAHSSLENDSFAID